MDLLNETHPEGDAGTGEEKSAAPCQRAIWLASYPKSGNTWVRIFIHNLIRELRGQSESTQDINALHEMGGREPLSPWFSRRLGKPAREATRQEIAKARFEVQADMLRQLTGPLCVKTHNAVAHVEGYPTVNFDVSLAAVYIVRNPLDVAVSYAAFTGLPVDAVIANMAEPAAMTTQDNRQVYEFLGSWSFHAASWMSIPNRPILLLRYEDMLAAPERSFARLAAFLRLNASAEQLKRAIEKSSFAESARQEEEHGFIERPRTAPRFFRAGKAGQWREALTQSQISAVIGAHAPMMMRFGYLAEDCGADGLLR